MWWVVLVAACHTEGLEGCDAIGDPIERENCRYNTIRPLVADEAALKGALAAVKDDAARDLVLLRLAVDNPQRAQALCAMTTLPATREKCEKVVGRPHMAGPPKP